MKRTLPHRKTYLPNPKRAAKLVVGIVTASFHPDITEGLLMGALTELREAGVRDENILLSRVPGSFELPLGCKRLIGGGTRPDAVLALGCIIKGETKHNEYLGMGVTQSLLDLGLAENIPVTSGLVTANNVAQAKARAKDTDLNRGREAAEAALAMMFSA